MALKYVGKLITDTQVFAMSEGITTTTYNIQKKSSLAVQKNDGTRTLYIVQAGTPVPSNDADCIGVVFENWDVTDNGGPIPIALSGTINEVNAGKLGITYTSACKGALKNMNFMGANMDAGAMVLLEAEPQTTEAAYAFATGLTYELTLTGDTFVDGEADKPINWIINLPAGLYVDSITKSSTTVYDIVIKALNSGIEPPADGRITFGVLEQALTDGNTPNAAICDVYDV